MRRLNNNNDPIIIKNKAFRLPPPVLALPELPVDEDELLEEELLDEDELLDDDELLEELADPLRTRMELSVPLSTEPVTLMVNLPSATLTLTYKMLLFFWIISPIKKARRRTLQAGFFFYA